MLPCPVYTVLRIELNPVFMKGKYFLSWNTSSVLSGLFSWFHITREYTIAHIGLFISFTTTVLCVCVCFSSGVPYPGRPSKGTDSQDTYQGGDTLHLALALHLKLFQYLLTHLIHMYSLNSSLTRASLWELQPWQILSDAFPAPSFPI